MALSDRAAAIVPYAQQLLDNDDVQDTARQAADATRAAYQRARGQDARKAVQDRKLRRRVTAAVTAVGEFVGAVSKARRPSRSRHGHGGSLLLAVIGSRSLADQQHGRPGADSNGYWARTAQMTPTGSSTVRFEPNPS